MPIHPLLPRPEETVMVEIKKILLAYDGSEAADKAYRHALDLAGKYGADLRVLAVASPPEFAEDVETEAILENAQEHYEQQFVALKEQVAAQEVQPRFEVAVGHPAEQIIYHAEQDEV
ncbi:universal stress protein, partial [Arthrospira platensis SPKY1]|nr:universal stress protein [Arthrospira platensis SPKY1]